VTASVVAVIDVPAREIDAGYRGVTPATVAADGGRERVCGGAQMVVEGVWPGGWTVVMGSDRAAAAAFDASAASRAVPRVRYRAATGAVLVVDGVEPA